ncbi:MAG: hypothetical protein PHE78_03825 [Candidatus Gastranaerophilales bacterium]|nr:hypothetical protein [Candidatus Gastranaerophilales bacterium]
MKKFLASALLLILVCNCSLARTLFYEDYRFHAEFLTEVTVSPLRTHQPIQAVFPSPLNPKIPIIIKGEARYKEINDKPCVELKFNEISYDADKYQPASIDIKSLNGHQISDQTYIKPSAYKSGLKNVKAYAHDLLMFPLNRHKSHPTRGKPTKNTFIVLLEPFYAIGSGVVYLLSPIAAPAFTDKNTCDIPVYTVLEFEFLDSVKDPGVQDL